ncbi:MAG: tryptophan--tRNA ligase [Candidatus Westeberhardia cardiocondylae]|nr:tryptophan--tRNA ligase [Candidatus Westeberhardia cardiocondylae]
MKKNVLFSAIQPTGELTLGNYIGVLRSWVKAQDNYDCVYSIADLHAITVRQDCNYFSKISLDCVALCLACGIDPDKCIIFIQSHVYHHVQLTWILSCYSYFGELKRMVQFKNRLLNNINNNVGLFTYPILMASDVLLYNSNFVIIGDDQKQHLEFIRTIARRFNSIYGDIFVIPKIFSGYGIRIMSLLEPKKKMSKSDFNRNNVITLLENFDSIIKKIKYSVTDSDTPPLIRYDPINKPGISNLLQILSVISDTPISLLEDMFVGRMYSDFKNEVINVLIDNIKSVQSRYYLLRNNEDYLYSVLLNGAEKAKIRSEMMLEKVKEAIGFFCIS